MFEGQTKIGLFFWFVWYLLNNLNTPDFLSFFCLRVCMFVLNVHCVYYRPKITRLDFKKSKLTLVVVEDDEQVNLSKYL